MAIRFVRDENLRGPLWRAILRHNASGGLPALGGAKVELVVADARSNPEAGAQEVEKLQGEGTDALLDLGTDDEGYLYAARRGGHMIRKFDPRGQLVETLETYAPIVHMVVDVRP